MIMIARGQLDKFSIHRTILHTDDTKDIQTSFEDGGDMRRDLTPNQDIAIVAVVKATSESIHTRVSTTVLQEQVVALRRRGHQSSRAILWHSQHKKGLHIMS